MSKQPDSVEQQVNGHEQRPVLTPRWKWTGPFAISLGVAGALGIIVGGLYLALMRVPAAPPRTQQIGSVRASVSTDPRVPWVGPAEVVISIVDGRGTPVADAALSLTYDMETDSIGRPKAGMGQPARATARMDSPGRYTAPVTFTMAGQWTVSVLIARSGQQEGQGVFLVTVR